MLNHLRGSFVTLRDFIRLNGLIIVVACRPGIPIHIKKNTMILSRKSLMNNVTLIFNVEKYFKCSFGPLALEKLQRWSLCFELHNLGVRVQIFDQFMISTIQIDWKYDDFYMHNCHIWFKIMLLVRRTLFHWTSFEIWRNRNEDIFQNVKKDTLASVNTILSYHSSMAHALSPTNKHYVTCQVRWNLPKGYIKVIVDDSSFGNHDNPGFGGLKETIWEFGFTIFFGSRGRTSNLLAELLTI